MRTKHCHARTSALRKRGILTRSDNCARRIKRCATRADRWGMRFNASERGSRTRFSASELCCKVEAARPRLARRCFQSNIFMKSIPTNNFFVQHAVMLQLFLYHTASSSSHPPTAPIILGIITKTSFLKPVDALVSISSPFCSCACSCPFACTCSCFSSPQ